MLRFCLVLLTVALIACNQTTNSTSYNIRDFGAAGNGTTKETAAIQKAVDAANLAGGGTVVFPPGKYLSGTIVLKSNVTLHLEKGATLLGSPDSLDYPYYRPEFKSYTSTYFAKALIWAEKQKNIGISGYGTIDGQGENWQWPRADKGSRPCVIRMSECQYINIENVRMRNSPMWMQQYLACDYLTVRGIHVWNHSSYNNDMIDIDCCHNVTVSDCYGNSDDDAMTIKSTGPRATENVTITNCVLSSRCNSIKMGTESSGGFKNIAISNCVVDSYHEGEGFYGDNLGSSGISLEMVDGGTLENITISNITIRGVKSPLFLRLGNRARKYSPEIETPGVGTFRNVLINNIIATEIGDFGCSILGTIDHEIENVTISNVRMRFPGGGTVEEAEKPLDEMEAEYPDAHVFGKLPAWGFFARHVRGLRMSNIDIETESKDMRPAFTYDDVHDLSLDGASAIAPGGKDKVMVLLRDVVRAKLINLVTDNDTRKVKKTGSSMDIDSD